MTTPAQAKELWPRVAEEEVFSAAIKDEDWPRATSLSQAALLVPTLPLFFRALYECPPASFPGREQHMRHHYDKCVEAIDAMQENADAVGALLEWGSEQLSRIELVWADDELKDPENSKGTYERIANLREGLKVVEELMAKEEMQGDEKSAGQDTTA